IFRSVLTAFANLIFDGIGVLLLGRIARVNATGGVHRTPGFAESCPQLECGARRATLSREISLRASRMRIGTTHSTRNFLRSASSGARLRLTNGTTFVRPI